MRREENGENEETGGKGRSGGKRKTRKLIIGPAEETHLGIPNVKDGHDVLQKDDAEDKGPGAAATNRGHAHSGDGVLEVAEDEIARVDGHGDDADVNS